MLIPTPGGTGGLDSTLGGHGPIFSIRVRAVGCRETGLSPLWEMESVVILPWSFASARVSSIHAVLPRVMGSSPFISLLLGLLQPFTPTKSHALPRSETLSHSVICCPGSQTDTWKTAPSPENRFPVSLSSLPDASPCEGRRASFVHLRPNL